MSSTARQVKLRQDTGGGRELPCLDEDTKLAFGSFRSAVESEEGKKGTWGKACEDPRAALNFVSRKRTGCFLTVHLGTSTVSAVRFTAEPYRAILRIRFGTDRFPRMKRFVTAKKGNSR